MQLDSGGGGRHGGSSLALPAVTAGPTCAPPAPPLPATDAGTVLYRTKCGGASQPVAQAGPVRSSQPHPCRNRVGQALLLLRRQDPATSRRACARHAQVLGQRRLTCIYRTQQDRSRRTMRPPVSAAGAGGCQNAAAAVAKGRGRSSPAATSCRAVAGRAAALLQTHPRPHLPASTAAAFVRRQAVERAHAHAHAHTTHTHTTHLPAVRRCPLGYRGCSGRRGVAPPGGAPPAPRPAAPH